jgi:6-phosphofructokinase 2
MKSSIFTLTLSPAFDKSTSVDRVQPEHKLRCDNPIYQPGGGGINVSRAIKKLKGQSVALYPIGGDTGNHFKSLLTEEGIEQITFQIKNCTRENFIVVERETNHQYRFGMPGSEIYKEEWEQMLAVIQDPKNDFEYFVVSGSTPKGVPDEFYTRLSKIVAQKNARLVLDTSGDALKDSLKEGIFLCKPNINELSEIVGKELDTKEQQEAAAMEIIHSGKVEILVVSLGENGALLASKEGIHHVIAPKIEKQSTVGAGDSMVAGMVLSLSRGKSYEDVLKYGVACGTAATMNFGTELCKIEDVERIYSQLGGK